jgi:hypothetical protein
VRNQHNEVKKVSIGFTKSDALRFFNSHWLEKAAPRRVSKRRRNRVTVLADCLTLQFRNDNIGQSRPLTASYRTIALAS